MEMLRVTSEFPILEAVDSKLSLPFKYGLDTNESTSLELSIESELAENDQPLIPGLPDDAALNCLLRIPIQSHATCRVVCRRWHQLLGSRDRFFTRRKQLRFQDPWLFVFAYDKPTGKQQWLIFDMICLTWHKVPEMPCTEEFCAIGFRTVSIPYEDTLYVCGGIVYSIEFPQKTVFKYEMRKNSWSVMNPMTIERAYCSVGFIDGMIYVAGGNGSGYCELESAEFFDPDNGQWRLISDMGTNIATYDGNVVDGKLLVTEGWLWPFSVLPCGQVYDPTSDRWEDMAIELRKGWTGLSVVVYDHLFVLSEDEKEKMKLKVYDFESDSWENVEGPGVPKQICKPFTLNSNNGRIYVVGKDLHIAFGRILRLDDGDQMVKKWRFGVEWEVLVEAPEIFNNQAPSSSQILFA